MRKFLGFLVAAVFVATVASNAVAQTTVSKSSFSAEISFVSLNTTFGFALKLMAGNKPASGDTAAGKITWGGSNGFSGDQLVPGNGDVNANDWAKCNINSKVYAEIDCKSLSPNTSVRFYTSNSSGTESATGYKFHASLSTTNAVALAAMKADAAVNEKGLPLLYKIINSSSTSDIWAYDTVGEPYLISKSTTQVSDYSALTSIQNLVIRDKDYGSYYVKDIKAGDTGATEFGEPWGYSLIATDQGLRRGNEDVNHYNFGLAGSKDYMFFATSTYDAKLAHRYGTDQLIVEVITE